MVLRVIAVLVSLTLCILTSPASEVAAGGPPACGPQGCYPAPSGPPPSCGFAPLPLCGACLGVCSTICGGCLQLPSAIMAGLLAPPPVLRPAFPPMPACGPPMPACAPPMCAPMPPPRPITKCRTSACPPQAVPAACPPRVACGPPMPACGPLPPVGPGCFAFCADILQMPVRLIAGALSCVPFAPGCGYSASSADGGPFGTYW